MWPEQLLLPGHHPSGTGRAALIGRAEAIEPLLRMGGSREGRNIIIGSLGVVKATGDLETRGRAARLFGRRASDAHPSRRGTGEAHLWDHHHRNVQGGGARAAMFGIADGLVTNVSLILGFAGRRRRARAWCAWPGSPC